MHFVVIEALRVNSLPASHIFHCLLIIFAKSLYPDQVRSNVRPDLDIADTDGIPKIIFCKS